MEFEEDEEAVVIPVNILPRNIYGLRMDVEGCIHYALNGEVVYPVENALSFHNYETNQQKFLRLPDETRPLFIAMPPGKKFIGVVEENLNDGIYVAVYDLTTLKKRRHLTFPENYVNFTIKQVSFTRDSRSIVLLLKLADDDMLIMFTMDKSSAIVEGVLPNQDSTISYNHIAVHPEDSELVAAGGNGMLVFMCRTDANFTVNIALKLDYTISSMSFLAMDLLLLGTDDNDLILIENGDLKSHQKASEAKSVHILKDQEQLDKDLEKIIPSDEVLKDKTVRFVTCYGDGFVFVLYNKLYVFHKISKFDYSHQTIITLQPKNFDEDQYQIANIAFDNEKENIIVTPKFSQIYISPLLNEENEHNVHEKEKQEKEEETEVHYAELFFTPLGQRIHIAEIVDVSICSWKPIIITASKDQTVRVWNYETHEVELVRKFQVNVNLVELSCTGFLVAIGFNDQLRLAQIYTEDLDIVKTFNFPRCRVVRFSNLGHYMAAGYDNWISIVSALNFDTVIHLRGHSGSILALAWTRIDDYIISGGAEGAIYQWDVSNGERVQEIVQKGTQYNTVCVTNTNPISIYAITNYGVVREFQNSELVREVLIPSAEKAPLLDMCLSRSNMVMFVTNTLCDIFNVHVPFSEAGGGKCRHFRFFASPVNKVMFTYDGLILITASQAGTLGFWVLENIEGRVAIMDKDLLRCQDILIPRHMLYDKIDQAENLELRLKQQQEEFEYQLNQNQLFDGQQLAAVHKSYCDALEELKHINDGISQRHVEEMNSITFQMNELMKAHNMKMKNLENQYGERMLMEYQKFRNLRDTMIKVRQGYEEKLQNSASTLQNTVEGLEEGYKLQLDERRELLRDLIKEMQDKKAEYFEYCRQVDIENEQNMKETNLKYEKKLQNEKNCTQLWRGRAGVHRKKYEILNKEIEDLLEELEILNEENSKSERLTNKLMREIDELQKEIYDRDYVISTKEKRIQELFHKNQELDKYKLVLMHKITELKAQIEPKEYQLNDKRKKIIDMENSMEELNQSNMKLEAEIKGLTEKFQKTKDELKTERNRSKAARECINNIRNDIYHLGSKIQFPNQLRKAINEMYKKYASREEIKRSILMDKQVREEYFRQRTFIENEMKEEKAKMINKEIEEEIANIFKENMETMKKIDEIREENKILRTFITQNQKERYKKLKL